MTAESFLTLPAICTAVCKAESNFAVCVSVCVCYFIFQSLN